MYILMELSFNSGNVRSKLCSLVSYIMEIMIVTCRIADDSNNSPFTSADDGMGNYVTI